MLYVSLLFFISISFFSSVSYGNQLKVQAISIMDRVFKDTKIDVQPNAEIKLWLAKNEYHSAQIAFSSDDSVELKAVSISDLKNSKTDVIIKSDNCSIRVPEYVPVEWNTRATPKQELDGRAPAMYPDPLPDFIPLEFEGSRSIWITCYASGNTLAGRYQGKLTVEIDNNNIQLPVELNVWEFSLPEESTLYVTNWLHASQLVKQYDVRRYSGKYWELINLVAEDLKAHRQNVIFTRLNIIQSTQLSDGSYKFDFKHYEKWVGIFLKHGFQAIEAGPLFHPKSFTIIDSTNRKKIRFNKTKLKEFLESKKGKLFLSQFLNALHDKNVQLGINDMYLQHVGDEARVEERGLYRDLVKLVHQNMPGVPVIDATHLEDHQRAGMMDIAVTNMHADESVAVSKIAKDWGKWWYTAGFRPRGKMPNRFIDYPLYKMRMISWLSWRYDMSGYLHYAYNWWQLPDNETPWKQVQYKKYSSGDAWVVYPPRDKTIRAPISSLRWETFRDGLEDYEYFVLLKNSVEAMQKSLVDMTDSAEAGYLKLSLAEGQALLDLLNAQIKSKTEYPRDPLQIEDIRIKIGVWLSANLHSSEVPVQ